MKSGFAIICQHIVVYKKKTMKSITDRDTAQAFIDLQMHTSFANEH